LSSPATAVYTLSLHDVFRSQFGGRWSGRAVRDRRARLPDETLQSRRRVNHERARRLAAKGTMLVYQSPLQIDKRSRTRGERSTLDRKSTRLNSSHVSISYAA